jgi:hypothetical protein
LGLTPRNCSAAVIDKIVSANAEHKSAAKAQRMLRKLSEISVSVPLIMDLTAEIGQELHEHLGKEQHAAKNSAEYAEPRVVSVGWMAGGS